jgi:hypothetical protein
MFPKNPTPDDASHELPQAVVDCLMKRLVYVATRLERHYLAQLRRLEPSRCVMHPHRDCNCADDAPESDPPS